MYIKLSCGRKWIARVGSASSWPRPRNDVLPAPLHLKAEVGHTQSSFRYAAGVVTQPADAFSKLLHALPEHLSIELAQALVSLVADDSLQRRYEELADRNGAGALTLTEVQELEELVTANAFLSVLKAAARAKLEKAPRQ